MDEFRSNASFQSYFVHIFQVEKQLNSLIDLQWRLASMALEMRAEHSIAHDHLMNAAASLDHSIRYMENVKWFVLLRLRASLQRHAHRNGGEWPSMDVSAQMNG